jgi:hypothetical protein
MKIAACFGALILFVVLLLLEPWHSCRRHRPFTTIALTRTPCGWWGSERNASASLKTLASAQADFRGNDRDENKILDFWRGDVAGLYGLVPAGSTEMIKLIEVSVAGADSAPAGGLEIGAPGPGQVAPERYLIPSPKAGYLFRALRHADEKPGALDRDRFAACAYPDDYLVSGMLTFILSEDGTIFKRDLGAQGPPEVFPDAGTLKREWAKLD